MDALPNCERSDGLNVVLVGLGFTTRRLARRLLFRGDRVFGVNRDPGRFAGLASLGVRISDFASAEIPRGAVVVHSIPSVEEPDTRRVHELIDGLEPARIVYISTTGVYGALASVNENSPVDRTGLKARLRIGEEKWVKVAAPGSLILRPAAIYGPGRGVHVRIGKGEAPRSSGNGVVSRIHVDDLAGLLEAAVHSGVGGEWPVADDYPCSSDEINRWCSNLLHVKPQKAGHDSALAGRSVDGSAIRKELGYALTYPDYQAGIIASLAEELTIERRKGSAS